MKNRITSIIQKQTPEHPTEAEMHAVADYAEEQVGRKPYRYEWATCDHPHAPGSVCARDRNAEEARKLVTESGMNYRELAEATERSHMHWNRLARGVQQVKTHHLMVLRAVVNGNKSTA